MPDSVLHTECLKNRDINTMKLNVSDVVESRETKNKNNSYRLLEVMKINQLSCMQCHTVSISFGLFPKLSISRASYLKYLIFLDFHNQCKTGQIVSKTMIKLFYF